MHNLISSNVRSSMPRVTAIETGSAVPSLSMISVGALPDFECPGAAFPDAFFPAKKDSDYASARAFCAACPVLERCRTRGDINERDIPKSGLFGMLGGETPQERIIRRANIIRDRPTPEYTDLPKCVDCGRYLRPAHSRAYQYPGTVANDGAGRCRPCRSMAISKGVIGRRSTNTKTYSPCVGCDRPLRAWSTKAVDAPGTVVHHSHGMCRRCYEHQWKRPQKKVAA